jgi:SAM-dependent methyltransferase
MAEGGLDAKYWDRISVEYEEIYDTAWSHFEDQILADDLSALATAIQGRRVLDIGCGTGLAYFLLGGPEGKIDYVGLDISDGMLARFTERFPTARVKHGSASELRRHFDEGEFDLVISTNVASSFLPDTFALVRDVAYVLAPGGLARLSFLNRRSLRRLIRLRFGAAENYRTRGDTRSRQTVPAITICRSQLDRYFAAAGFAGVACQYRSVLGGVWETGSAIRAELALRPIVPWLGHEIIATGERRARPP